MATSPVKMFFVFSFMFVLPFVECAQCAISEYSIERERCQFLVVTFLEKYLISTFKKVE